MTFEELPKNITTQELEILTTNIIVEHILSKVPVLHHKIYFFNKTTISWEVIERAKARKVLGDHIYKLLENKYKDFSRTRLKKIWKTLQKIHVLKHCELVQRFSSDLRLWIENFPGGYNFFQINYGRYI